MTHRLSTVLALAIPVSQHQRFDRVGRDFRYWQPAQPVDATHALNLSAGVSNCKVSRGRSLS